MAIQGGDPLAHLFCVFTLCQLGHLAADSAAALSQGRVALLGDSAHAMQPNLGQGGCMAIEDGYLLAIDLAAAQQDAQGRGRALDVKRVLQGYQVGLGFSYSPKPGPKHNLGGAGLAAFERKLWSRAFTSLPG